MLGNWTKTFVLMAAITALFVAVGGALGGTQVRGAGCVTQLRHESPLDVRQKRGCRKENGSRALCSMSRQFDQKLYIQT